MTHLELTSKEVQVLQSTLTSYLSDLEREIARTDARDYRRSLVEKEEVLSRLLARLSHATVV